MDVVVWLRGLGLGKYEAAFRENEIDEAVLPSLTHETLKELGVAAVGHRLKLLDAIAALRGGASAKEPPSEALPHAPASTQASAPSRTAALPAEAVGERRYLTVMFCDLVDSTGIAARLDAEEWRDLVGAYLDAASAAVTEMGGHVAKKLGDGLMALFGYPVAQENDAERANAERAVKNAREMGQATTLMYALRFAGQSYTYCGNYAAANAQVDELIALADERGASYWNAQGTVMRGSLFALTKKAADAVRAITTGITSLRSTGTTLYEPRHLWFLAMAYAELGQLDDASRCIDDAIDKVERSKQKWCEAEVHRIAGEIALKSLAPDLEKAEAYFEHALAVARQQQAKSWELRAAMSMARLRRDQDKRQQARDLLAPVYGWFTEGFDTLDLKEAKTLLDELHA